MTPQVEEALGHLLDELAGQVYGQPLPHQYGERRALLEAMWAREIHFIAVSLESETPEELRVALIADGTLLADYA